jgi:histidine phosphotransferase ChpT
MSDPKLTSAGFAAQMCARIAHDLISPIAALGTAIEVLDDPDNADMHEDAIELVKTSARQASGKLQFLRLAFGAGGSAPGVIGVDQLKTLTDGIYGDAKAEIIWNTDRDGIEKDAARLLLNLIMLGVQAVPRGGSVTVLTRDVEDQFEMRLTCVGPKARLADAVKLTLAGKMPEDGFDGRTIQPFYAGLILRELGGKIAAGADEDRVVFSAKLPHA